MKLRDHISREFTFVIQRATDKRGLLARVVQLIAQQDPAVDSELLLSRLMEREDQVTTGIGHGVAIPHATLEQLERPRCVVAQIPAGLDYEALDGSPVHVLFMLLSPPDRPGTHLRLLARIARLVDSDAFIARMAQAPDPDALHDVIVAEDSQHV